MQTPREAALEYHRQDPPGKLEVVSTKPVGTQRDLTLAYSPGVAEPCREIHRNPHDVFSYTARGNLVAVVTNGTAVLGLGNIGPMAAKPVMEGKAVLFKKFAGIDVFDLEVGSEKAEDVIQFCRLLEPTVGGINLEDISAPDCFEIERVLRSELEIPVFHDDQHGTAIIAGAALINAISIVKKELSEVRVVFSGAGASAIATARHLLSLGVQRGNVVICDSKGVIHGGRENLPDYKSEFAAETEDRTLAEAMNGADVFIGLSVAGAVTAEMVASMAPDPVIFALANPDPEILPEAVEAVRSDAIMATGRSDYPNQVNNVLGFPFIFRGALDVRASAINEDMKMAATHALAELARTDVPEAVASAYGQQSLHFGRRYLIPTPFDHRVLFYVAPAVAEAAMKTGVAREEIDLDEYRDRLKASLGPAREVMRWMTERARRQPARVVIAEGHNDKVIRMACEMVKEGVARPVLMGRPPRVLEKAERMGLDLHGVDIVYAAEEDDLRETYAKEFYERRMRKGLTLNEARSNMFRPIYFAAAMVRRGDADALVAGIESNYPEVLRPSLEVIGVEEGVKRVAGLHMVAFPNRELLFMADTTVNIDPDPETLADIAILSAELVTELGIEPRIAMVSFSNFGSARHPETTKVAQAVDIVRVRRPDLQIDGEMQADTALDPRRLSHEYPFSHLQGGANVLVFSHLAAANASYKLLDHLANADVIGPILMGMDRPVHILQRGSAAIDVLNLATIASVEVQAAAERRATH